VRRRLRLTAVVLLGLVGGTPQIAGAANPGYLTLSFGRTQWVTSKNCVRLPNTIDLGQVAAELDARGLAGTGNVVTGRTPETGFTCFNGYVLHPGWDRLATLRDGSGWTFVSASRSYANIANLTPAQQWDESCGTLQTFEDQGHTRAWGLFAYPNDSYSVSAQTDVVSTCFAYGRTYDDSLPLGTKNLNIRSQMAAPWFQRTSSLFGGSCNDPALPCYSAGYVRRYGSVTDLRRLVQVGADRWFNLQAYRFVTGARGTLGAPGMNWDCRSPDWRAHWASASELYCWADYKRILNAIPSAVVVTDPASVAEAWGRIPPS
jgi:hypothetical protein